MASSMSNPVYVPATALALELRYSSLPVGCHHDNPERDAIDHG